MPVFREISFVFHSGTGRHNGRRDSECTLTPGGFNEGGCRKQGRRCLWNCLIMGSFGSLITVDGVQCVPPSLHILLCSFPFSL